MLDNLKHLRRRDKLILAAVAVAAAFFVWLSCSGCETNRRYITNVQVNDTLFVNWPPDSCDHHGHYRH